MTIEIISRERWGAKGLLGPMMQLPAKEVFLHHSVTDDTADMFADIRLLETIGIKRFGRMSYSFAIHPQSVNSAMDGAGLTIGAHTAEHNSTSFGIVWIGNYQQEYPTPQMIDSTAELIKFLELHEFLVPNAPIRGHRDVKATACPGQFAYSSLPTIRALVAEKDDLEMPYTESQLIALMQQAVRAEFLDAPPYGGESLRMLIGRFAREIHAEDTQLNQGFDSWFGGIATDIMTNVIRQEFLDDPPYGGSTLGMVVQRFAREISADSTLLNQALDQWWENGPKQQLLEILQPPPDIVSD